ncbi:MAG: hypothetical protein GAK29_00893 [Acinetobacter bereziniae]|uniref:NinB family protein n=1 Tax=Acinetobacter bereziniae TaxID=106648 RepID=A0A833UEF0_ACIBZ|nr:MAG: hypothetical protein GAK29_00893 [Acinetobacter bereziniae]
MNKRTPTIEPVVFVLKAFDDVGRVIAFMHKHHSQAMIDSKPLVVKIDQKQEERSRAQNRLYWMWLTQWSKYQGTDKESEHLYFKKQFLAVIFNRDDVGEYRQTFAAVKVLKEQQHEMYQQVADGLNSLISTVDASIEQFTEYLNDIHGFCMKHGCYLKTPDDLMFAWEMNS